MFSNITNTKNVKGFYISLIVSCAILATVALTSLGSSNTGVQQVTLKAFTKSALSTGSDTFASLPSGTNGIRCCNIFALNGSNPTVAHDQIDNDTFASLPSGTNGIRCCNIFAFNGTLPAVYLKDASLVGMGDYGISWQI